VSTIRTLILSSLTSVTKLGNGGVMLKYAYYLLVAGECAGGMLWMILCTAEEGERHSARTASLIDTVEPIVLYVLPTLIALTVLALVVTAIARSFAVCRLCEFLKVMLTIGIGIVALAFFCPVLQIVDVAIEGRKDAGVKRYSNLSEVGDSELFRVLIPDSATDVRLLARPVLRGVDISISCKVDQQGIKDFSDVNGYAFGCYRMNMQEPDNPIMKDAPMLQHSNGECMQCLPGDYAECHKELELSKHMRFLYDGRAQILYVRVLD